MVKREKYKYGLYFYEKRRQLALTKAIGVSAGIISLWENGLREPTLSNLIALADYFGITLDDLVGRG